MPTDDVLIARKALRGEPSHAARGAKRDAVVHQGHPWRAAQTLVLVDGAAIAASESAAASSQASRAQGPQGPDASNGGSRVAVVCVTLDEVRDLAARAFDIAPAVGAVLAPYIPSALVALFSAAGIAAIHLDAGAAKGLKGQRTIALPAPSQWPERAAATIAVGPAKLPLTWLARGRRARVGHRRPQRRRPARRTRVPVRAPIDERLVTGTRASGILSIACRRASSLGKNSAGC